MTHPHHRAAQTPNKSAIIHATTGRVVTYAQLESRANKLAHLFRAEGLNIGDTIAIFMEDCPEFLEAAWAAQRIGLFFCPVYTAMPVERKVRMVAHADVKFIVTSRDHKSEADKIAGLCPQVEKVLTTGPYYEQAISHFSGDLPQNPATGQPTYYSAGTTGEPKGVRSPISIDPFDAPDLLAAIAEQLYGFNSSMVFSTTAPMYHVAPLRNNMLVHRLGGTVVLLGSFDPRRALEHLQEYGVTHTHWVPHMFTEMVKLPDEVRARFDASKIICALHGAAPCPPAIKQAMIDWWGPILHEFYSGTEGVGLCTISSDEWLTHRGSVGKALVGDLKILSEAGAELTPGHVGQVYFANGLPFQYYKDKRATDAAYNDRGWVTLEDIGHVDEDGYLYLLDRKAFVIKREAAEIYPRQIEDHLIAHDCVLDAGATVDADGHLIAVIKLTDAQPRSRAIQGALHKHCGTLPEHHRPSRFHYCECFPRDADGKIDRDALRRCVSGTQDAA